MLDTVQVIKDALVGMNVAFDSVKSQPNRRYLITRKGANSEYVHTVIAALGSIDDMDFALMQDGVQYHEDSMSIRVKCTRNGSQTDMINRGNGKRGKSAIDVAYEVTEAVKAKFGDIVAEKVADILYVAVKELEAEEAAKEQEAKLAMIIASFNMTPEQAKKWLGMAEKVKSGEIEGELDHDVVANMETLAEATVEPVEPKKATKKAK